MPISSAMLGLLLSMNVPSPLAAQAPAAPEAPAPPRAPRSPRAMEAPAPPSPPAALHAPGPGWAVHAGHSKARLGTQVSSMTRELRSFFGAPEDAGLLVQRVELGSAAEAAKVEVGDVLVEVDGERIAQVSDVRDALADRSKGDVVEVVVVRKKKRRTLKATLTRDAGPTAFSMPPMPEFELRLPPEARRFMSPEAQEEVRRELERAREQLREAERRLESVEIPGAEAPAVAPPPPEPPSPPAAPKAKRKRSAERKR